MKVTKKVRDFFFQIVWPARYLNINENLANRHLKSYNTDVQIFKFIRILPSKTLICSSDQMPNPETKNPKRAKTIQGRKLHICGNTDFYEICFCFDQLKTDSK